MSLTDDLNAFVADIEAKLASMGPEDFLMDAKQLDFDIAIIRKIDLELMSKRLVEILGEQCVDSFFDGYKSGGGAAWATLYEFLLRNVLACCHRDGRTNVSLNKELLTKRVASLASSVSEGAMQYSVSLHLTNIAITSDWELTDGIEFHWLTPEELRHKYPMEHGTGIPGQFIFQHWPKHRVEVRSIRHGKPAEMEDRFSIEAEEMLENSITDTFYLAGIPKNTFPVVTHAAIESPLGLEVLIRGCQSITFDPHILTADEIELLRKAYRVWQGAQNDRVLLTALDRFVIGLKQYEHHPNRTNEPNWDKIVDYTIAMETLFLTVNGQSVDSELTYRFRLNGSSLLSRATGGNVRSLFCALNHLYKLRSTVVHGSDDSALLKPAKSFLKALGVDRQSHAHARGQFLLVSRKVEEWLRASFLYVDAIAVADRPYRKQGAWEDMLWGATTADDIENVENADEG